MGTFFRDTTTDNIISLQEIVVLPKEKAYLYLVMDDSNIQNVVADFKEDLYNLIETTADIGIAGNVEIVIDFDVIKELAGAPAYIGMTSNWNGDLVETSYKFVIDSQIKEIKIFYNAFKSDALKIHILDEENNVIDSRLLDDCNGEISLDEKIIKNKVVSLKVDNKDTSNLVLIQRIEAIYTNGERKVIK